MDKALKTMIDNMPDKTGKSLDEWIKVLKVKNFDKHSEAVKFLKDTHGVTHGYANTIVTLSKENPEEPVDLVSAQYAGKESLKPLYDRLISFVETLGKDVTIAPKKTSVSIIRKHQFALIKPATKSRMDLGLKLKGIEPQGVLETSGPFGTMCTHRIQLKDLEDINDEVTTWLTKAYDMSV
ncbi:hypothetical protein GCM10011365_13670 [Marinicella pacifica]|uniref:DUF5655 domain-containing protein n=1 Tax=Marinicella pacifica TaxID=1171543 RepID=A0A917FNV6_9GAMM|nr:DUF4287 domain-containing protein [Marinicella pacifica]GGF93665.1 hypothetical protein GCM10011365_13670 [Marinicella pacifica]